MIYNNIPAREIKHEHDNIHFNRTLQEWGCAKCNKNETTKNKRTLAQHATREHPPERRQQMPKRSEQTHGEHMLMMERLRTIGEGEKHPETQTNINTPNLEQNVDGDATSEKEKENPQ